MKKDVNGITIAYHDQGTGPPIVFLHAFPLNRTMWAAQEAALSRRFRTISIDARGLGESDAPFWRYSMEQYARDVKELLASLRIGEALFVGLSMGGYLEFALYRIYPTLVRGLVLADTRAEADTAEQVQWRFNLAQRTSAEGPSAVVAEMLPKLLARRRYEQDRELVEKLKAMIAAAPVQGIVGALMAMAERPDSTGLLPTIASPTLVVVGADDVLTPPLDAERIAGGICGAELVISPDAGHLSNLEQPARFSAAVEDFAKNVFQVDG